MGRQDCGRPDQFYDEDPFESRRRRQTYEDKHYYKGTVKGDEIVFTMVTDSSTESHTPIHFTANRVKNK